ncbi:fimbria/pilus outer membrane usher protein [Oceanimonas marisflavi]|uniref:fimbria/pilus outer membrane usher protein n=1 Tax=Oceanimonas marisflavi TaxID=2059724 RepID=UPI001E4AED43|nr:fimbria/pilus outer membrane usher protein [Oceanimonas marisflavi]
MRSFVSLPLGQHSLGLSYTERSYSQRRDVKLATASYSLQLGAGSLRLSALHLFNNSRGTEVQLSYHLPLGAERTSASLSLGHSADRKQGRLQLQRSLPAGNGLGYRLQTGLGDDDSQQASLALHHDKGVLELETARQNAEHGYRASARGGLLWFDKRLFATRSLNDSFALVTLPGLSQVMVYADNRPVATTNSQGQALLTGLRPYERNRIRVEHGDIPLNVSLAGLEHTVVPYYRSGVRVDFSMENGRDAFFHLVNEAGETVPAGATVIMSDGRRFPVGFRGEVFLTNVAEQNTLQVRWRDQACRVELAVPDSTEPVLDLGGFVCRSPLPGKEMR